MVNNKKSKASNISKRTTGRAQHQLMYLRAVSSLSCYHINDANLHLDPLSSDKGCSVCTDWLLNFWLISNKDDETSLRPSIKSTKIPLAIQMEKPQENTESCLLPCDLYITPYNSNWLSKHDFGAEIQAWWTVLCWFSFIATKLPHWQQRQFLTWQLITLDTEMPKNDQT